MFEILVIVLALVILVPLALLSLGLLAERVARGVESCWPWLENYGPGLAVSCVAAFVLLSMR